MLKLLRIKEHGSGKVIAESL